MSMSKISTNFFVFLFLLSGLTPYSYGQSYLTKQDFAYGNEIEIVDYKSIVDVELPEDFYQVTRSGKLEDIAVFNANNEVVPHVIITPESTQIEKVVPPIKLNLFPIYGDRDSKATYGDIQISTSKDGTIISITNNQEQPKEVSNIISYLIDASKINQKISRFRVVLDEISDNNFVKITLSGSHDLTQWTPIETSAVLAKFEVNAEKLQKDEINLNGVNYPYFMIAWPSSKESIKLSTIQAEFFSQTEQVERPLQWNKANGQQVHELTPDIYQYDLDGFYPVFGWRFKFADQNSIARVSISSAMNPQAYWTNIHSSLFYTIQREGSELSNLSAYFPQVQSRYWRMQLNSNRSGFGNRFPDVYFGWRPQIIRFLARGQAPFTLAYGSATKSNRAQPELVSSSFTEDVGHASLKSKSLLGGAEKLLKPLPEPKASAWPMSKIILWAVLILGALLLLRMALDVKRNITNNDQGQE